MRLVTAPVSLSPRRMTGSVVQNSLNLKLKFRSALVEFDLFSDEASEQIIGQPANYQSNSNRKQAVEKRLLVGKI